MPSLPSMLPPPVPPAASFLSPQQAPPASLPFLGHSEQDGRRHAVRIPSQAEFVGTLSTGAAPPMVPPRAFLPTSVTPSTAASNEYYSPHRAHAPLPSAQGLMAPSPPLSDQLDPLWWMNTDILSLPEHFGNLPDLFEQAFLLGPYYQGGGSAIDSEAGLLCGHERDRAIAGGCGSGSGGAGAEGMNRQDDLGQDNDDDGQEAETATMAAVDGRESEMTGLDAIATAAAAAAAAHPLGGLLGATNGAAAASSTTNHGHNDDTATATTTTTTTTTSTTTSAMMMIGADGLFDLRSFLEHGGDLAHANTNATTAAAAAGTRTSSSSGGNEQSFATT